MILTALLLVIEVLVSLLLIGVILIQKSKGGGLGGSAFGGGGESLFGVRTGNVLTKLTITLSIIFLANTLLLAFNYAESGEESVMSTRPAAAPLEPLQPVNLPGPDAETLDLPGLPVETAPPAPIEAIPPAPATPAEPSADPPAADS